MRKKTLKLAQSERILPPLKIKTTISTRSIFTKSPVPEVLSSPKILEKPLQPEQSRQFVNHGINLNLNKKVNNLLKIIKEQDEKIKFIESELKIFSPSASFKSFKPLNSSANTKNPSEANSFIEYPDQPDTLEFEEDEKNLEEFYLEAVSRDKQKDIVIFKLKKQIDEDNTKIQKIVELGDDARKKLAGLHSAQVIITKSEEKIGRIKEKFKNKFEDIEKQASIREQELQELRKSFEELAEILQKSEEKRQYSNEYNIFMEGNEQKLKEKVKALKLEKEKLKKQILEVQEQIFKQEVIVNELQKSIHEVLIDLEDERQKNETVEFNLGIGQEALTESLYQNKMQEKKFENDLNYLEQQIELSLESGSTDKTGNKYLSLSDKHFTNSFSREETIKLQQKYNRIEKDLNYAREALERLKKNESYLKNQFVTKDLMISQIEKMLSQAESNAEEAEKMNKIEEDNRKEEEKKRSELVKVAKSGIAELQGIIVDMIESYNSGLNEVKCNKCMKLVVDPVFLVPCGHLACSGCWGEDDRNCRLCGEGAVVIKSKNMSKVIGRLRMDTETIMKANRLLS